MGVSVEAEREIHRSCWFTFASRGGIFSGVILGLSFFGSCPISRHKTTSDIVATRYHLGRAKLAFAYAMTHQRQGTISNSDSQVTKPTLSMFQPAAPSNKIKLYTTIVYLSGRVNSFQHST